MEDMGSKRRSGTPKALIKGKIFYPKHRHSARICKRIIAENDNQDMKIKTSKDVTVEPKTAEYEALRERNIQEKMAMLESLNLLKKESPVKKRSRKKAQSTGTNLALKHNVEPEKSEYEALRERNIQEKLALLESLNFSDLKKTSPVKRRVYLCKSSGADLPGRPSSRRIRKLPPEKVLHENDESKLLGYRKKKSATTSSSFKDPNSAHIDHMLGGYLSKINQRIKL